MNEHETICDIIAEMRMFKCRNLETGELELCNAIGNYFADRLEAVLKREHKEKAAEAQSRHAAIGESPRSVKTTDIIPQYAPVSNCAKLREALVSVQKKIHYLIGSLNVPNSLVASRMEINGIINAALAAPPRNCDKYATADEALKAQEQMFNDSNFANGECKLGCPECDNPRVGCKIAWLFAPATEKEGGDDGRK